VIDPRQCLEEYADGLLAEEERLQVEEALASDAALRDELQRVRGFSGLLLGLEDERAVGAAIAHAKHAQRRRSHLLRLATAAGLIAAVMVGIRIGSRGSDVTATTHEEDTILAWVDFGQRLGRIAKERRSGRVPRQGIGDLSVPPAEGYGVVFRGALGALDVALDTPVKKHVQDLVRNHFVSLRDVGANAAGECRRADAALALYRELRAVAGTQVADAYYDVFRPALATPRSVASGQPRFLRAQYEQEYKRAVKQLRRRYGRERLSIALRRLAGADRRFLFRDAAQDGVGRDAVLAIRARLYRAACDAGVDRLYIAIG